MSRKKGVTVIDLEQGVESWHEDGAPSWGPCPECGQPLDPHDSCGLEPCCGPSSGKGPAGTSLCRACGKWQPIEGLQVLKEGDPRLAEWRGRAANAERFIIEAGGKE